MPSLTRAERIALFRARARAARTHADFGHSGSWASCPLPACRDAQKLVPEWPEIDLGDVEGIAADISSCTPLAGAPLGEGCRTGVAPSRAGFGAPSGLEPYGLSPRARLSAIALCGTGMFAALLGAFSCGGGL